MANNARLTEEDSKTNKNLYEYENYDDEQEIKSVLSYIEKSCNDNKNDSTEIIEILNKPRINHIRIKNLTPPNGCRRKSFSFSFSSSSNMNSFRIPERVHNPFVKNIMRIL
jgi:hypothetical protein